MIAKLGVDRIVDGDVILTYAKSHVVEKIFKKAFDEGKRFRVIIVDSRYVIIGDIAVCSVSALNIRASDFVRSA